MKKNIIPLLGFWSSVFIALLGAVYLGLLIVYFATQGFTFPPGPVVQLVGGVITFLTAPALLVQFTAIRYAQPSEKAILGSLGVSFITLFAAVVSINRFVQLTVIQQAAPAALSQDLVRFLPYDTGSVMFALEMLGWGVFSSLAALAVAPLFAGGRLNLAIRWLWLAYALFSSLGAIGYAAQSPISTAAFIAWGPILLAVAILLALYFRNQQLMGEEHPGLWVAWNYKNKKGELHVRDN